MKQLLLILGLLGQTFLIAQPHHRLALQFRPIQFVDFQAPSVMLGINTHFATKWGVNLDVGIPLYGSSGRSKSLDKGKSSNFVFNEKYIKIRIEPKYYYHENEKNGTFYYFGLENFYTYHRYDKLREQVSIDNQNFEFNDAKVKNDIWGSCLKWGMEQSIDAKGIFMLGLYGGLGVKVRNVQYQLGEHWQTSNTFSNPFFMNYPLQDRMAGIKALPYASLGFSFIFKIF